MRFSVLSIMILTAVFAIGLSRAPRAQAEDEISAAERYALCERYTKRRLFTKALEACNRVRNFHRDDPVSILAELTIAELYELRGDREQARLAYEDFVRLHPRHEKVDFAIWKIGYCWWKAAPKWTGRDQAATRQAVSVWSGFERRFPKSDHLTEVRELTAAARDRLARKEVSIARFYMQKGPEGTVRSWGAVRARAEGVVERYDDTPQLAEALYLAGRAAHAWGDVTYATERRALLAAVEPSSIWLARLDRALDQPPGTQPPDKVFLRPYRVPAVGAQMGGSAGAAMPGM